MREPLSEIETRLIVERLVHNAGPLGLPEEDILRAVKELEVWICGLALLERFLLNDGIDIGWDVQTQEVVWRRLPVGE